MVKFNICQTKVWYKVSEPNNALQSCLVNWLEQADCSSDPHKYPLWGQEFKND